MFRTFARKFLPNPLDWKLKRAAKKKAKTVLLCWNRGLGDIALGVAPIIHRIREFLPDAQITVLTRENLKDGFSLLPGIEVLVDPTWKRGVPCKAALHRKFDLVFEKPSPTDWCRSMRKVFTPRLKWNSSHERPFELPQGFVYIGVQAVAETNYGLWRNWPIERWNELFSSLEKRPSVRILLFGYGDEPKFPHPNVIDLRGKTTFFELFSIIKNRCSALILPDSGVLSISYYLDVPYPIRVISLFADPDHGILKQGVASPNPLLIHTPIIAKDRDLSTVSAERVEEVLFPKPLKSCPSSESIVGKGVANCACVILAGGQGTRLGFTGPKGLYPVLSKPLFLHHMEKVSTPVAVMTSQVNHEETVSFFEKQNLKAQFFQQKMIPLLDENLQPQELGPDGNGGVFECLVESGILDQWEASGIDTVLLIPVENPLANPSDEKLIAYHRSTNAEVTIKCVERIKGESMGAVSDKGIVEYFNQLEDNYAYSYTGQLALSVQFIRKAAIFPFKYHWVRKNGLWKRERLIFDAFAFADRIEALCYDREVCYAPIKGPESRARAEQLLMGKK